MDQQTANQTESAPSVWEIYYPGRLGGHNNAVYVSGFPEIIYFWPTIITLFLSAFFQGAFGLGPSFFGWLTVAVLSLNLLCLVQDFDQKKFLIFALSLITAILILWIIDLYGFTFIKGIAHWFLSFQPTFSTDAYLLLGMILLVLFSWGIISPMFSYWKLEQNEFIHFVRPMGRDMSIARVGCTINMEIPDVFEWALGFGAGKLIIRRDTQVLAIIPNVPFLSRRMAAIEHMLSETRVYIDKKDS